MFIKNNKGFTVIELIMSFLFASILSLSLFSAVLVYREKQTDSSIETDLLAFKSQLIIDVQNDIQLKGIKEITTCPKYDDRNNIIEGVITPRCVILKFNDDTEKVLKVEGEVKQDVIESADYTETFDYDVLYFVYGDVKYEIPDGANVYIDDGYVLSKTDNSNGIEGNRSLYRIYFNLKHNNIDKDIDISIVASGTNINTNAGPYETYNVGNKVKVQVNKNEQLDYVVIEKSDSYKDSVTLLYNGSYDNNLIYNSTQYNNLVNLGNRFNNSEIKRKLEFIEAKWNNIDSIRLITIDEIARLSSFCPQYRGIDSPDLNLAASYDWLTNKNYWTMSEKITSGETNGKKVWVVDGSGEKAIGASINENYAIRPVIVVKKTYVTGRTT